jgi:hypothetical protein
MYLKAGLRADKWREPTSPPSHAYTVALLRMLYLITVAGAASAYTDFPFNRLMLSSEPKSKRGIIGSCRNNATLFLTVATKHGATIT